MPLKKKAGGRKGGKRYLKRATIIDGIAVTDMTKEQLEGHIYHLQKEIEKERDERNYFQIERDRINEFWDITKNELQEKEAEIQLKDRKAEDIELSHMAEIKIYKKKMKLLMLEYQNQLNTNVKDNMKAMRLVEDQHRQEEKYLWKEKHQLILSRKQMKSEHNDFVQSLKLKHNDEITKLRQSYDNKIQLLHDKQNTVMEELKQELEQSHHKELQEIQEIKKQQFQNLTKSHEKSFIDMKNYYNDITQNNLSLIGAMKDQIEILTKKEKRLEKQNKLLSEKNEVLSRQLQTAQEELALFQKKVEHFEKEKDCYDAAKSKLRSLGDEVKKLKWNNDVLIKKLKKAEKERDSLYSKFKLAIQNVEEKIGLKTVLLEKKMGFLKQELEQKEIEINYHALLVSKQKLQHPSVILQKDSEETVLLQKTKENLNSLVGNESFLQLSRREDDKSVHNETDADICSELDASIHSEIDSSSS